MSEQNGNTARDAMDGVEAPRWDESGRSGGVGQNPSGEDRNVGPNTSADEFRKDGPGGHPRADLVADVVTILKSGGGSGMGARFTEKKIKVDRAADGTVVFVRDGEQVRDSDLGLEESEIEDLRDRIAKEQVNQKKEQRLRREPTLLDALAMASFKGGVMASKALRDGSANLSKKFHDNIERFRETRMAECKVNMDRNFKALNETVEAVGADPHTREIIEKLGTGEEARRRFHRDVRISPNQPAPEPDPAFETQAFREDVRRRIADAPKRLKEIQRDVRRQAALMDRFGWSAESIQRYSDRINGRLRDLSEKAGIMTDFRGKALQEQIDRIAEAVNQAFTRVIEILLHRGRKPDGAAPGAG